MRCYHPAKILKIWIFPLCTVENSNFRNFCSMITTQPQPVLKLFLLYLWFMPSLGVRSPWPKSKGRSSKKSRLHKMFKQLGGCTKKNLCKILNNISDDSNPKKDKILTTQAHLKFYVIKSLNSIRLSFTTYDLIRNMTSEYIYRIQHYSLKVR